MSKQRRRFGWIHERKLAGGTFYYVQWTEPNPAGGPGRRVTRSAGRNLKDAKKMLGEMESRFLTDTYSTPQTVAEAERPETTTPTPAVETFVAYAARTLKDRLRPEIKPKTLELYEGNLAALSAYFGERAVARDDGTAATIAAKRLDEIRAPDFLDYRAWRRVNCRWKYGAKIEEKDADGNVVSSTPRPVSDATINRDHHFAGLIFGHAVAEGLVAENPLARVRVTGGRSKGVAKFKEAEGRRRALSKGEVAGLILRCEPQLRPLVLAALFTGCRRGELLALRWSDVNNETKKIEVYREKDRSRDSLDLHPVLAKELAILKKSREGVEQSHLIFLNRYGKPWKDVRAAWRRAVAAAGLGHVRGLCFHSLRHTFATHFLTGGGAITDLQAQLGHSKITTTQRYAAMVNERRRDTVLALDFGTKTKAAGAAEQVDEPNTEHNTAASGGG